MHLLLGTPPKNMSPFCLEFLRVGVANVGSVKGKKLFDFEKNVAMLALLARCHVPILSHEAAWNMMMFYLLSIKNDVTCSHL